MVNIAPALPYVAPETSMIGYIRLYLPLMFVNRRSSHVSQEIGVGKRNGEVRYFRQDVLPLRACAMKNMHYYPYYMNSSVTLIWGRYRVPLNVFLVMYFL